MLQLKDINLYYGVIHALKNVSLHIKQGEIVTLIGSNGAGKSSTLRAISGVERIKDGSIQFNGVNISKLNPSQIVSMGLSHVPEGRRVFPKMSIMDNLEMGAYTRKDKAEVKRDYEKVFDIFPRLKERRSQIAGTLSGGEQQMLAIGRALMSKPKLLLLDEPSMGLAPLVVKEIFSIIQKISSEGTTVLLVEQNASMALKIADRAYIIANGVIEIEGKARELLHDDKVKKAYLGG